MRITFYYQVILLFGPNGDVGNEENSGSDRKGKWSKMLWVCVEEG